MVRFWDENKKSRLEKQAGVDSRVLLRSHAAWLNLIEPWWRIPKNWALKGKLEELKANGQRVAGYGATSKSTTLYNYAGIGPDLIEYISDTTPTKVGKFTPGTHIPIRSHDHFVADNPPFSLLLAWNHKREIYQREQNYRKSGGKFITFFPELTIE